MKVWPGQPYPLGAVYDGSGTNFSLFSEIAERVELCLFDEEGNETPIDLPEVTGYCWHGYLPTVEPGQRYGFRVYGPWDPVNGHRCNPAKMLLDPYAKAIDGKLRCDEAIFPYRFNDGPDARSDSDSASLVPRCVVHQPYFDWSGDRHLQRKRQTNPPGAVWLRCGRMCHRGVHCGCRSLTRGLARVERGVYRC